MKMYVWTPNGHGNETVMVVADSEEMARTFANNYVQTQSHGFAGWGTAHYVLAVYEPGQVATNPND